MRSNATSLKAWSKDEISGATVRSIERMKKRPDTRSRPEAVGLLVLADIV